MKEELLHYLWKFQKFNKKQLYTTNDEEIQILDPGQHNHHSGPDFLQAKVKIDSTEWVGTVEIHIKSSDWFHHYHQNDRKYDNVILHVVWEHDLVEFHRPTLELNDKVSNFLLNRYEQLMNAQKFVSCQSYLPVLDDFSWSQWKQRLVIERMQEKSKRLAVGLQETNNDWREIFYQQLAYNFGLNTNQFPMLELAKRLSLKILSKHRHNLFQLEALLFGTAGLLYTDNDNNYLYKLRNEYQFFQKKYRLQPLPNEYWNFGKIRPASFPTLRIAQLAKLIHQSYGLFSKCIEPKSTKELYKLFSIKLSGYWETHYTFNKESKPNSKSIGRSKIENIIINTIVPFQFYYGKETNNDNLVDHSLELLQKIKKEKNKVTTFFESNGIVNQSAFDSQAFIHLHQQYCQPKNCLQCRVANKLFNKSS